MFELCVNRGGSMARAGKALSLVAGLVFVLAGVSQGLAQQGRVEVPDNYGEDFKESSLFKLFGKGDFARGGMIS